MSTATVFPGEDAHPAISMKGSPAPPNHLEDKKDLFEAPFEDKKDPFETPFDENEKEEEEEEEWWEDEKHQEGEAEEEEELEDEDENGENYAPEDMRMVNPGSRNTLWPTSEQSIEYIEETQTIRHTVTRKVKRYSVQKPVREKSRGRQRKQNAKAGIKVITDFSGRNDSSHGAAPAQAPPAAFNVNVLQTGSFINLAALQALDRQVPVEPTGWNFWSKKTKDSKAGAAKSSDKANDGTEAPPISTQPGMKSGRSRLIPAPLKLEDDLSPSDRPIVIGLTVSSARLAEHTQSPQIAVSDTSRIVGNYQDRGEEGRSPETRTPTIMITRASEDPTLSSADENRRAPDRRPTSSIYSQGTNVSPNPSRIPAVTPYMMKAHASQRENERSNAPRESTSTAFDEDVVFPQRTPTHRTSTFTVFEEDETPTRSYETPIRASEGRPQPIEPGLTRNESFNTPATARRSKGWWNYVMTPFMTRSNTVEARQGAMKEGMPNTPNLEAAAIQVRDSNRTDQVWEKEFTPTTATTISSDTWWDRNRNQHAERGIPAGPVAESGQDGYVRTHRAQDSSGILPFVMSGAVQRDAHRELTQPPLPSNNPYLNQNRESMSTFVGRRAERDLARQASAATAFSNNDRDIPLVFDLDSPVTNQLYPLFPRPTVPNSASVSSMGENTVQGRLYPSILPPRPIITNSTSVNREETNIYENYPPPPPPPVNVTNITYNMTPGWRERLASEDRAENFRGENFRGEILRGQNIQEISQGENIRESSRREISRLENSRAVNSREERVETVDQFQSPRAPPPYSPPRTQFARFPQRVQTTTNGGNTQYSAQDTARTTAYNPSSPGPVSPGMQQTMTSNGGIPLHDVPLDSPRRRPINLNSGYPGSVPPRTGGAYITADALDTPSELARKAEAKRKRHEKEEAIGNKIGGLWRGRWCFPKRGCAGRKGNEGRKKRRCYIWAIIIFLFLIGLILGLVITLTRKSPGDIELTQWLNLTGFPPIFLGVSTVAVPVNTLTDTSCVSPLTFWSCDLPKELQPTIAPNAANQPNFRLQIQWDNSSAANATFANVTGDRNLPLKRNDMTAGQFFNRLQRMLLESRQPTAFNPVPAAPSFAEEFFLGNTTDGIVSAEKAGEPTPFFITFLSPTADVSNELNLLNKRQSTSSNTSVDNNFPDIIAGIPPPSINTADNTASPANLLPSPLPIQQPLRLYDRGLPTEHYSFYSYFDRSIFLSSVNLTTDGNGPVLLDENGGATEQEAKFRCTWAQTRFLVQIWTNMGTTASLNNITSILSGSDNTQISNPHQPSRNLTASDFSQPGSFPLPITLTIDRHGGDATLKEIYCYEVEAGVNEEEGIGSGVGYVNVHPTFQLEDRAAGGTLFSPAPSVFDGNGSAEAREGGIDGGSGGCKCGWGNFVGVA